MASTKSIHSLKRIFIILVIAVIVSLIIYVTLNIFPNQRYSSYGYYPDTYPCHYTKLRKVDHKYIDHGIELQDPVSCRPRIPLESSCRTANTYFGSPRKPLQARKCNPIPRDICWFKTNGIRSSKKIMLFCSSHVCSSKKIFMSKRDHRFGDVKEWTEMKDFTTKKAMEFVEKVLKQGEIFCFIKCGSIKQLLVFPPEMYLKTAISSNDKININILTLDSVSRPHFYRMLRKSVEALRNVTYNQSLAATVLDFELFQSISPHTFENMRPLFSGVVVDNTEFSQQSKQHDEIGIEVLYKYFQRHDYQTIFQEDLCWYDRWGTILDNIKMKGSSIPSPSRWETFNKTIQKHQIDHFGVTFFSCEAFKKFNDTNHFETPNKVCFNGKLFSSYFLRYLKGFTKAVRNTLKAAPYISYTHFNTGHTASGVRIGNIDEGLADFISNIARDPLTWTILLSDHGHKTTMFVRETSDGKYETFNPLLFMIIPQKVAQMLGKERMKALKTNQNRLMTTLDIHRALMTLYDKNNKSDVKMSGIFSKIPSNRSCTDVPIMPLTKCQCFGTEQKYEDNSPKHQWMAEFATGTLNNLIQKQYSKGRSSKGFGNCKRLIGSSFRNIVQTDNVTTFDLHVNAHSVGLKQDEVFKIAVATKADKAVFLSFERQTMYNKFKDCVDGSVNIKICVCDQRIKKSDKSGTTRVWNGTEENFTLIKTPMFRSKTSIKRLHGNCLLKVNRLYSKLTEAVEVANLCKKQSFTVSVTGWKDNMFISHSLPIEISVQPNTIHFLYSTTKQSLSHFYNAISLNVRKQE